MKNNLQTKKNNTSVKEFIDSISDDTRKRDSKEVLKIMKEITGKKPAMWGSSIVGFGSYHYKYASGREGDWMAIGFSPRKQALTLYIMPGYQDFGALLKKLGAHSKGKSCLYIKDLKNIHLPTLKKIIKKGYLDLMKIQKS